ncbi:nose resistant to fluoxetine protein 6-like [Ptychodera flava]|uniref:nose resistant to fluoxetine protein 6-like n=1 Tax=Ptychodera flava TaxID=63121 RepID=UPI003969F60C
MSVICNLFVLMATSLIANALKSNIMDPVFAVLTEWPNPNATGNPLKNVTLSCYRNMQEFGLDLLMAKNYAREMYESSGSFRTDYDVTYDRQDLGHYWMCRRGKAEKTNLHFGGQYCVTNTLFSQNETTLFIGTCFPDSCTEDDVAIFVSGGFRQQQSSPHYAYSTSVHCVRDYSLRTRDIVAIVVCTILLAVIIVGTAFDVTCKRKSENPPKSEADYELVVQTESQDLNQLNEDSQFSMTSGTNYRGTITQCLRNFSILESGRQILHTDAGQSNISCLNGIRVISMFWIVLMHVYVWIGQTPTGFILAENYSYIWGVLNKRWTATVLWQGFLGVEAFFVLSGLLASYWTLQQFDKCGGPGKHRWWLFYLHRYWRLTPVYAFCLMMYATLTLHMGNGVWWFSWYSAQETCQNIWWTNLLYINNLYPFPGILREYVVCMGWSWYLAVDMQLYVISPVFIVTFYKSWKAGLFLSIGTTLCSFGICAYLATVQGMPVGMDTRLYRQAKYETGEWIYSKPYYRIPQYLVGVGLGYVLFKLKGKTVRINKILNVFLWCVAAAIALAVVYGVYPTATGHRLTQFAAVIYNVLHRFAFSVSIGWVIFACATGNGGK